MVSENIAGLGSAEARHVYGPRTIVASIGGNGVSPGNVGFQGALASLNPAAPSRYAVHSINRDKFSYQVQNLPGTIPEPERWAMLIVGFGLTGGAMRWKRRGQRSQRIPVPARSQMRPG